VSHVFTDLGYGTNEDAEWLGLIRALELVQAEGIVDALLLGDALAVVRQANAALVAGAIAAGHARTFQALHAACRPARIRWIKRSQNLAGIALASRHPR
jgi:Ribonuclease HI